MGVDQSIANPSMVWPKIFQKWKKLIPILRINELTFESEKWPGTLFIFNIVPQQNWIINSFQRVS